MELHAPAHRGGYCRHGVRAATCAKPVTDPCVCSPAVASLQRPPLPHWWQQELLSGQPSARRAGADRETHWSLRAATLLPPYLSGGLSPGGTPEGAYRAFRSDAEHLFQRRDFWEDDS